MGFCGMQKEKGGAGRKSGRSNTRSSTTEQARPKLEDRLLLDQHEVIKCFPLSSVDCSIFCSFLSNPNFQLLAIDGW